MKLKELSQRTRRELSDYNISKFSINYFYIEKKPVSKIEKEIRMHVGSFYTVNEIDGINDKECKFYDFCDPIWARTRFIIKDYKNMCYIYMLTPKENINILNIKL